MRLISRTFLAAFILCALALLVFGPTHGKATDELLAAQAKGFTIVTYWEKWTGNESAQMQQIVDDFNQGVGKEKRIFVQYLSTSEIDRKALIAAAGGVPPDIAGVWDTQLAPFASLGALTPLDDMALAHGITAETYKPVYWDGCRYDGRLYGLISTPSATALHYNKRAFEESADKLRAAGCEPDRPPETIEELDKYAAALDQVERGANGQVTAVKRAGYLPLEPGWFLAYTPYWFGAELYDEKTHKLNLLDPRVVQAFEWVKSYSVKLGANSITEFKNGLGSHDSTQNAFFTGQVVMVQQGPWEANFIENRVPQWDLWHFIPDDWASRPAAQRDALLEEGTRKRDALLQQVHEGKLSRDAVRKHCEWAAAPFPSTNLPPGAPGTYCGFDLLTIPTGAKHRDEAFEFIAYVQRQAVMEKLNSLHCKNSPLRKVSPEFIRDHPNPYIEVFEALANSPNAHTVPRIPIWPVVNEELSFVAQKVYYLRQEPRDALNEAQKRLQLKLDDFFSVQQARKIAAAAKGESR